MRVLALLILYSFALIFPARAQEDQFNDELVSGSWPLVVGITFDERGYMYAWSKDGKIYVGIDGVRQAQRLLSIRSEVAIFGDHGLLGFALHPNFLNNGYFYLLYAVNRNYWENKDKPDYDPNVDIHNEATFGRITRYTADASNDFLTVVPGSRKVLVGETPDSGFPLLHRSHGVGSLVFATDGTLMATCGDGASYAGDDFGGDNAGSYGIQGQEDGIITWAEDQGAYRAQQVNSLSGKMIRIDPETGDGISSNPYFLENNPRAPQSRVWSLGFRNPFRFTLLPGSGSHNPEDGDPGVFFVGDVGWAHWEEINVVDGPGQNFGWPIYEGMRTRWNYAGPQWGNRFQRNPLSGSGDCDQEFFTFQSLLQQDNQDPDPFFPNPCDANTAVPQEIPTFVHRRPMVSYSNQVWNQEEQGTHIPAYEADGKAKVIRMDAAENPVVGETFTGVCIIGGTFYTGNNFPASFNMTYLAADFSGWLRQFIYGPDHELLEVREIPSQMKDPVAMAVNPNDGCLYYINYAVQATLRKICLGGNPKPTAVIQADTFYGPGPLTVQFKGDSSSDPEDQPLTYAWDFGDGTTSTEINPTHTFEASGAQPASFDVKLTVTDSAGAFNEVTRIISLNNTPPQVTISSFKDGDLYSISGLRHLPLEAEVVDAEHDAEEMTYAWQVFFHHNTHFHPEPIDSSRTSLAYIAPEGCSDEEYWYRIGLTVTDPAGLETYVEGELFPYCGDMRVIFDTVVAESFIDGGGEVRWTTTQEPAGVTFTVERGTDVQNLYALQNLDGKGTPEEYAWTDADMDWSENLYRIKATHTDGFVEYSPAVELQFLGKPPIWVYPNPAEQTLFIDFAEIAESATVRLYTIDGKLVRERKWDGAQAEITYTVRIQIHARSQILYPD
ncbi:MAG: PQQ-dependent sugar dehydrogenase, partial [Bacteroidota bacterium]